KSFLLRVPHPSPFFGEGGEFDSLERLPHFVRFSNRMLILKTHSPTPPPLPARYMRSAHLRSNKPQSASVPHRLRTASSHPGRVRCRKALAGAKPRSAPL